MKGELRNSQVKKKVRRFVKKKKKNRPLLREWLKEVL